MFVWLLFVRAFAPVMLVCFRVNASMFFSARLDHPLCCSANPGSWRSAQPRWRAQQPQLGALGRSGSSLLWHLRHSAAQVFGAVLCLAALALGQVMCSAALVVGALCRSATLVLSRSLDRPLRRSRLFAPILGQVLPLATPALNDFWRSTISGALVLVLLGRTGACPSRALLRSGAGPLWLWSALALVNSSRGRGVLLLYFILLW